MAAPLQISTPCHEDWASMTPNAAGRHCEHCALTVTDLTAMSAAAARAVLARAATARTQLCVRADTDRRGRILLPGITRRLLTNGLAAVLAMAVAGCEKHAVATTDASAQTTTNTTTTSATKATNTGALTTTNTTTTSATTAMVLPDPPAGNDETNPENGTEVTGTTTITMGETDTAAPALSPEAAAEAEELRQHPVIMGRMIRVPQPAEDPKPPAEPVAPANTNANG